MFDSYPNLWTPITFSENLREKPLALTLAGERVALFRDSKGTAKALIDRCPHRGVALSLGHVVGDCLECPFHGWQFDGSGACKHVPLNGGEAKLDRLGATSVPTVERAGLIFLFTGENPGELEPHVPPALEMSKVSRLNMVQRWNCHWTRAMENMLDTPHLPFVHRKSIGRGMVRLMKDSSKMELTVDPRPHGFKLGWSIDGAMNNSGSLQWWRPNAMELDISFNNRLYKQHIYCVPVSATETDMMVIAVRDFGLFNPLLKLFDYFGNRKIIAEDQAVVESSDPPEIPMTAEEKSVATDKPTLVFRTWYRQHMNGREPKKSLRVVA